MKNVMSKMNLPNKLTCLRILLVPLFMICLLCFVNFDNIILKILPLIIFVAASVTDALDGHIARRDNLITDFGKFMDPLADKILVNAALICFVQLNLLAAWIVVVIISREFLVSGFRMLAAKKGITIAANIWGKLKTVSQMILVILILLKYAGILAITEMLIMPFIIIVVALTIVSAVTYLTCNKKIIETM